MLRISSAASTLKLVVRPLGHLLRDLAPWLIRATVGWLLARTRRMRSDRRQIPCQACPFLPGRESPAPGPTKIAPLIALSAGAFLAAAMAGCAPAASYVAAERATYDAVAPEYAAYIDADPSLDAARRSRRHRTLDTWRLRLEQAESSTR